MSPRRKRQSAARKSLSATPSVVGDKIRTAAAVYEKAGQRDRAEGMRQAADIVDKHARGGSEDLVDFALMQIDEAVGILTGIRRQVRADLDKPAAPPGILRRAAAARLDVPVPSSLLDTPKPRPKAATSENFGLGNHHVPAPVREAAIPIDTSRPTLTRCEAAILRTLKARGTATSKPQVAVMTGYRVNSGSFNKAFTDLKAAGYIDVEQAGLYVITEAGSAAIGEVDPLPTGREALGFWTRKLGACAGAILQVMYDDYPRSVDKEDLADRAGALVSGKPYSSNSGSFNKALTQLRKIELVEGLRASRTLMETS
jgi:hypothetical protein